VWVLGLIEVLWILDLEKGQKQVGFVVSWDGFWVSGKRWILVNFRGFWEILCGVSMGLFWGFWKMAKKGVFSRLFGKSAQKWFFGPFWAIY